MKAPSLALRIIGLLALAQLPAFLLTWLLLDSMNLLERSDFEELIENVDTMAISRTTELVRDSLIKDRDGSLRIEPTPALREEMRRVPGLQFAAFDANQRTPIAGSSEKLATRLSGLMQARAWHAHLEWHAHFTMNDVTRNDVSDGRYDGHLSGTETPFGYIPIAVYGFKFRWGDLLQFYPMDRNFIFAGAVIAAVVTSGTAWLALRRGLKPLAEVSKEVEHIDMSSLNRRLSTSGVPTEIRGLVDVVNDALRRLESGAEKQRRFAANAAHELRTPLAVMRAQLENAEASAFRNELLTEASKLRTIVEQMLVSTRLAEGQLALDQELDLEEVVGQLVSRLVPLAMDRDRFLAFEEAASPAVIRGNQGAIESVVTNLIDNALREEPEEGTVCVRMEDEGVIAVIDHGKGVPPKDRELIFERFWRKSEASSGAGLGLAIAKDIIDAHGGRIWVEETPGGGATFKLSFPAQARSSGPTRDREQFGATAASS